MCLKRVNWSGLRGGAHRVWARAGLCGWGDGVEAGRVPGVQLRPAGDAGEVTGVRNRGSVPVDWTAGFAGEDGKAPGGFTMGWALCFSIAKSRAGVTGLRSGGHRRIGK